MRPQNTIQLVQKPSKKFQEALKQKLRLMKRQGFELYQLSLRETAKTFDQIKVLSAKMKTEQSEALKLQDEQMRDRVERRLNEI